MIESDLRERDSELSDTSRTGTFSDGVLAIAMTLLVLTLAVPAHRAGGLGTSLLDQWPAYVSFLGSFIYIAVIWLNHHAAFRRIQSIDRVLNWANIGVFLGAVILPFPTAVLAEAFRSANHADEQAAVTLYAIVAMLMSATWLIFFQLLTAAPTSPQPMTSEPLGNTNATAPPSASSATRSPAAWASSPCPCSASHSSS